MPAPLRIEIRDAAFLAQLRKATADGLRKAGDFLAEKCRHAVNTPNPYRPGANAHNQDAGKPPYRRTGAGRASIVSEYNDDPKHPKVRIGVNQPVPYMAYLELGTPTVWARPWLLATLEKNKPEILRLALGGK